MTKQESLHILDECIEYLDGLSDEEIDKLATEANEYMAKPFEQIQQSKGDSPSTTEVIAALTYGCKLTLPKPCRFCPRCGQALDWGEKDE